MSPVPLLRHVMAVLLLAAAAGAAFAQDPGTKTPRGSDRSNQPQATTGGAAVMERFGAFLVGDEAPDVDLTDTDGTRFHLAEARRAGPWLLVFARTPDDLTDAQAARAELAELGVSVVGIAPFKRQAPGFDPRMVRLLPDHANHVARTYGMFDPVTSNPRPGAILVGRDGRMLLIVSGGTPSKGDLVRMTREALFPPKKDVANDAG